jgi:L,D-transpeptidase YcbB
MVIADEGYYHWDSARIKQDTIDSMIIHKKNLFALPMVLAFYQQRNNQTAWTKGAETEIDTFLTTVRNARWFGLNPDEFGLVEIDSLRRFITGDNKLLCDILLTDTYFKFAHHLRHGRLNNMTYTPVQRFSDIDTFYINTLETALHDRMLRKSLVNFEPLHTEYDELKEQFQRKLLQLEQGLMTNEQKKLMQSDLLKMAINLERWRWEEPFPERYLLVNIPSFTFRVMHRDSVKLTSKVIVGLPGKRTPVLNSVIECMVVYPYWHVPRSIATKELLPLIKKNPHYLTSNHFEVFNAHGKLLNPNDINWKQYSANNFPFKLRQMDGSDNALGIIKFQFENPYGIYLHDTNARILFSRDIRALSHGCIRAEKAVELGQYLLNFDHGRFKASDLEKIIANHKKTDIDIKKPLPIFVRYFTADGNGVYADVYSKDAQLLKAYLSLFERQRDEYYENLILDSPLAFMNARASE